MEEESPGQVTDTHRLEGLLDLLGARYDQFLSEVERDEEPATLDSADGLLQQPGSWLNSLKHSDQDSVAPEISSTPSQSLQELGTAVSQPGLGMPQSMALPQIPGAWATNHLTQTGSLSIPPESSKAKVTTKLDVNLSLLAQDDITPGSQAKTDPFSWYGLSTPPMTPIPIKPRRKNILNKKKRLSLAVIACLVMLSVAGASWWLQQVPQSPDQKALETQQRVAAMNTPASTPGAQRTPDQTAVTSHHQSQTPTSQKATSTPTSPIPTTTTGPTKTPTQASSSSTTQATFISFEDGGLDGWTHTNGGGTISMKNLATSSAVNGSHVLMVAYDQDSNGNFPAVGTSNLPASLNVGQTIKASVLKTQGSDVEINLYLIDQTGQWFDLNSAAVQVNNDQTWYTITLTVPSSLKGPITQLGLTLYGYNAVVYIDGVSWQ